MPLASNDRVITEESKQAIVSQASHKTKGINGVLVCDGDMFFQIIEGRRHVIEELFAKLKADKRHKEVTWLDSKDFQTEEERMFPGWDMKALDYESNNGSDQFLIKMISTFRCFLTSVIRSNMLVNRYTENAVNEILATGGNPIEVVPVKSEKVIMFVDLVNYTTITEFFYSNNQYEQVMQLLNDFFDSVMDSVEKFGGDVTKLIVTVP